MILVIRLVGKERLELSLRKELEPKSSASTNFATHPRAVKRIPASFPEGGSHTPKTKSLLP